MTKENLPEEKKQEEIWKDIEGFEGYFQISTFGRVKRLARFAQDKRGNYHLDENILKTNINNHGYVTAILSIAGKATTKNVHRLVAEAFIPNPECLATVNHISGVKHDNNANNLEWMSRSDNQKHAYELGLQKPTKHWEGKFGKDNPKSKAVYQIDSKSGEIINEFGSVAEAARETGAPRSKISLVCNGERNTTGGYKWRFVND